VQIASPILALRLLDLFPHARGSAASVQSFTALMLMALVFGVVVPAIHGSLFGLAIGSAIAATLSAGFAWAGKQVRSIEPVE
jgi:DHA1 family bicyclomycin/chloramphenicol resistance-like MFS transporter